LTLDTENQQDLLAVARQALAAHLLGGQQARNSYSAGHPLSQGAGAFVTLRQGGRLRGCIGRTTADMALYDVVARMAVAAGSQDPRFTALQRDELPGLSIAISVLGPLERCSASEVVLGLHGLVVEGSGRRGLLLPEVPTDFGWGVSEFIERTCEKAGLPKDAIAQGADLFRFQTQHFSEG